MNATATALQSPATETAPRPELAADQRPAAPATPPPAPKACPLCFSKEKHGHVEGAMCSMCGHAHGDVVRRGGRDRKVVVRHSLPVVREGGRDADGRWANPGAQWMAPAICDDCAWDLRRVARKADVRAPRYFDLAANVAECAARDERDVEFRMQRDAARKAEKKRHEQIVRYVASGYHVSRGGPRRNDSSPRNGNGDQRRNDGPQRRDKRLRADEASAAEVRKYLAAQEAGLDGAEVLAVGDGSPRPSNGVVRRNGVALAGR